MRKSSLLIAAALTVVGAAAGLTAPAGGAARVTTDRARYVEGERVSITVENDGSRPLKVDDPIVIARAGTGEEVATYSWSGRHSLPSGESLTWHWDQWRGECVDDCAHPDIDPPDLAGPGRYEVRVDTTDGTLTRRFAIGEQFTIGFRGRAEKMAIFSVDAATVARLRAEAQASEKTLVVSGIVRAGRAPYNRKWSFFLDPGSIVAAEAFAEVCDAAPDQVEDEVEAWEGRRWCPWSSYVESAGR